MVPCRVRRQVAGGQTGRSEMIQSLTPHIVVRDAAGAAEWYKRALGAEEIGRSGEPHSLRLDVLAPAAPALETHLVPAPYELAPERDRREGVPGVAESGDEHAGHRSSA